jgi:predicted amino acid dehydrogenase
MAEALVLGFEPGAESSSSGTLTADEVRTIGKHAASHGFSLADVEMERSA